MVDLEPVGGGVEVAVVEDAVPGGVAPGHHRRPGGRGDGRDAAPERPVGGSGEQSVEVGHHPPPPHRVEHRPGRAVESEDNQAFGLRHVDSFSIVFDSRGGDDGWRLGFWDRDQLGAEVEPERGLVMVAEPPPLDRGSVNSAESAADFPAPGQIRLGPAKRLGEGPGQPVDPGDDIRRRRAFDRDGEDRVGELTDPLGHGQTCGVRGEHPPEAAGGDPPVVVGEVMNPEVEREGDDENAAGPEDAEHLVEGAPDLEDMLEGLDGDGRADRPRGEAQGADVLDPVDAGAGPEVGADVGPTREQPPEVGIVELSPGLVRAELVDRPRAVERLGDDPGKSLGVVSQGRAPLLEARSVGRSSRRLGEAAGGSRRGWYAIPRSRSIRTAPGMEMSDPLTGFRRLKYGPASRSCRQSRVPNQCSLANDIGRSLTFW